MQNFKKYEPDELKHLQQLELKILKEVISICESHDIKYYASSGTALGAVRHGGFIPWDDDVDIALFRDDYEKLLKILDSELGDEYYVLNYYKHEDFTEPLSQVCLKGTEFRLQNHRGSYKRGIFIDLFPMDNVPESKIKRKIYYPKYLIYFHFMVNYVSKIETDNKLNSFIHSLLHRFVRRKYSSNKELIKKFDKYLTRYHDENTNYVTIHFSRTLKFLKFNETGFFDKRDFEPSKKIKFEDTTISIPHDYHKILTIHYGDYMTLPPEEKRYNHAPEVLDFGKY